MLICFDKQIEMLAFTFYSQDIKKYIQQNKKEYIHWLIQDFVIQAYEKYGDKMFCLCELYLAYRQQLLFSIFHYLLFI